MSLNPIQNIVDFVRYMHDKHRVMQTYESYFHRKLNWRHPTRYTEKINVFKISKEAEDLWPYVDKIEARKYIEKVVGSEYLIPLIGIYNTVEEIPFDDFPKKFVLKTTHGSHWNIICLDKNTLDIEDAKKKLRLWMSQNYYEVFGWERQYKKIKPRIICEEYIDLERDDMIECKWFCLKGKPYFITIIQDRLENTRHMDLSPEWEKLPFATNVLHVPFPFPKPKNLTLMREFATKLASPFRQVRVDFYCVGGKLYVGELTFSSVGGMIDFSPDSGDELLGSWYV